MLNQGGEIRIGNPVIEVKVEVIRRTDTQMLSVTTVVRRSIFKRIVDFRKRRTRKKVKKMIQMEKVLI